MTPERRAQLEAAGHTVASPEDFFGLDEVDRIIVQMRIDAANAVKRLRDEQGISQRELARRINVSQSRIAGIEKGRNASLDKILTAYVALGGSAPDFGPVDPSDESSARRVKVKKAAVARRRKLAKPTE